MRHAYFTAIEYEQLDQLLQVAQAELIALAERATREQRTAKTAIDQLLAYASTAADLRAKIARTKSSI